jgi:uncharacterized protein DUF1236
MTNRFLISAAVAALIAGTGFANAQGTGGGAAPSAQQGAPSSATGSPSAAPMNRESGGGMKGAESEGAKEGAKGGMHNAQSREGMSKDGMKGEKSAQDGKSGMKDAQSKDGMSKDGTKNAQSKDGMSKDGTKNAQSKDGMSKDGMKDAQSKDGMSKDSTAAKDGKSGATTGNAATSATAGPPAEKRTQIVSAIKSEKIEQTTNVNFNISVGATVPSTVRFHPLPPRIVEIYPEWRGYEVILVSGRYIVVRPRTHEIVYIIEG